MIVFVDSQLVKFVETNRIDKPTFIIESALQETSYFEYKEKIDEIISDPSYCERIKSPDRVECKSSLYNIVQYSKFYWLERATQNNPFSSDYFIWLDAGISRFFDGFDIHKGFTSEKISSIGEKLILQIFQSSYPDLYSAKTLQEDYLWDDRSFVAGGILMSHKNHIDKIKKLVDKVLTNKMLDKNLINNEQICLGYLLKENPDLFECFHHQHGRHRNYEILNFLQQ